MVDPLTYASVMSFLLGAFVAAVFLLAYLIVRDRKKEALLWNEYMKAYQSYQEAYNRLCEERSNPAYTQEQYEKARETLTAARDKWRENNNEPA